MNRSSSSKEIDSIPTDEFTLREVNSGGSPRGGGSFKLSQAVAAEKQETRKRLSRELVEGNFMNKNNYRNYDDDENDEDDEEEEEEEEEEENDEDGKGLFGKGVSAGAGTKMSLMDLLEENDRKSGIDSPAYQLGKEEEGEEEEEEEEEDVEEEDELEDDGKVTLFCSVCKVKHKGSAFIHCGHTYCRLCSKELSVEKGNCPVCNDFVTEILDVL